MIRITTVILTVFVSVSAAWAETAPAEANAPVSAAHVDVINDAQEASAQQMRGIWYSLSVATTESGRMAVIQYAMKKYYFSPIQAEALIEVVQSARLRGQLIAQVATRLTHKSGVDRLLRLMPDGPARDALLKATTDRLVAAS